MKRGVLQLAAECYGIQASTLKALSGGHWTDVYGFSKADRDYVLRLTRPNDEIDVQAMKAILEWMRYLAKHGGSVTTPVLSQQNRLIELVEQGGGCYVAVAFEKGSGILAETLPVHQWGHELRESLGRTVGQMHALAKRYIPRVESLRRPEWDQIGNCFNPAQRLDATQALLRQKQQEAWETVHTLPRDQDSYGLIHADLHFGNLLAHPDSRIITVLDFDDCCYGWYVMDTAMIVFDILVLYTGSEREEFARSFMESYIMGYLQETHLGSYWMRQLPHFLKLLEIGVYTQLYRHYDPDQADSWVAKFMPGRKHRIEDDVPYLDIDFVRLLESASQR